MQKKLIDYIKAVGTETNNLSFGKDEIEKIIEEQEVFTKSINADVRTVIYVSWKGENIVGCSVICNLSHRIIIYQILV